MKFTPKHAEDVLKNGFEKATELLKDTEKVESFLQSVEEVLASIPFVGEDLKNVPLMISLIRSYITKEYTQVPTKSLVAIISASIYFVTPADVIPDVIPLIGYIDDGLVFATCYRWVKKDLEEYSKWREEQQKLIEE